MKTKYEELRTAVIWACTHYKLVDIDGIFEHLQEIIEKIEKREKMEERK